MNYEECAGRVREAAKLGIRPGLESMRALMKRLGDPQDSLKVVHVAGTNGKGSLIAYLRSALTASGLRCGVYTSPAVYDPLEVWGLNEGRISREDYALCMSRVIEASDQMQREGLAHPTPFEMETAMAFVWSAREKCDLLLLETGMGGRLDATNIVKSTVLSVIMPVSLDHTAYLGESLSMIAAEKAGIIREGVPVLCARQSGEAEAVLKKAAALLHAPCYEAPGEEEITLLGCGPEGSCFLYRGERYEISLAGCCQVENACTAIGAFSVLAGEGLVKWDGELLKEALLKTRWRGRFTTLVKKPLLIADGAHNPGAAAALAENIRFLFPGRRDLTFIMGMFRDKDIRSVLSITAPYAKRILCIQAPGSSRAEPAGELARIARDYCPMAEAFPNISEAVSKALDEAGEGEIILAFGSLAFLGVLEEEADKWKRTKEGFYE